MESSILQKIVAQRLTQQASFVSKHAVSYQFGGTVESARQAFTEFKEGRHPPERVVYWVTWTLARIGVGVASTVASTVLGSNDRQETNNAQSKKSDDNDAHEKKKR